MRGSENSLWILCCLFVFYRTSLIFSGAKSLAEAAKRCTLELVNEHIKKADIMTILSPSFITYIWVHLEIFLKLQRMKPGPSTKEFSRIILKREKKTKEMMLLLGNDMIFTYNCPRIVKVLRIKVEVEVVQQVDNEPEEQPTKEFEIKQKPIRFLDEEWD